jgi:ribosomal protein S18 acetylase RimI-like enzyme
MSFEEGQLHTEHEPKIEIVAAAPEDVRGMQEVFYRTWLATYPNEKAGVTAEDVEHRFKNAFTDETFAKRAERITNPPEGERVFVAKSGNTVVGVCRIVEREAANQLQANYVLPEYQGKGVGTLLWKEAQRHFNPEKDIIVQVAAYNQNAIDFYTGLGFEDTGKRWSDKNFQMQSGAEIPELEMILANKK